MGSSSLNPKGDKEITIELTAHDPFSIPFPAHTSQVARMCPLHESVIAQQPLILSYHPWYRVHQGVGLPPQLSRENIALWDEGGCDCQP
ncbi:hypothetical protein P691DRAFT_813455 [Macrolepiota fuliginosa MF-IS2]|uniref:Uncharacterized protein n=1 Tax=Macrolepiota fuliginosa MF-IS2 TaxID=1400762 RepID=A0A9P5XD82_9AGAR|nr:hypothetical protein P691DRAFT_813455 [Macrolepiota fuliginosa MF-IS2]